MIQIEYIASRSLYQVVYHHTNGFSVLFETTSRASAEYRMGKLADETAND